MSDDFESSIDVPQEFVNKSNNKKQANKNKMDQVNRTLSKPNKIKNKNKDKPSFNVSRIWMNLSKNIQKKTGTEINLEKIEKMTEEE